MFLALKEMRKEKLRYSLIIAMIVLISYLIFILTSLALGLAQQNTDAINSWGMQSIIMNKDADISLSQSLIKKNPKRRVLYRSRRPTLRKRRSWPKSLAMIRFLGRLSV